MLLTRNLRITAFALIAFTVICLSSTASHAQAALLMEEPYGFFGALNPTGHNAIYFERVCAETPVRLRRCAPGELGSVIARYQGIASYDWVAIPLIPYLYSVENTSNVPQRATRGYVHQLRDRYREANLNGLGDLSSGSIVRGGWTQLVGVSYERSIFAFRFETTEDQDDAFIAWMNDRTNRSHFNLLFNNCSDFARLVLNFYFPGAFERSVFPDAGMTTPKQLAHKLERYARKHPETQLAIFEISQIPGYRRRSRTNKGIAESLATTTYAVPIALLNPYLAGGLFVDYLVRGRYHVIPKHPQLLAPDNLMALTATAPSAENPGSAGLQAPSAVAGNSSEIESAPANYGLKEMKAAHE
ncbi:MAG: hypothetical protein ABR905_01490 [Terracidiphilus sp.]|jgi:hypothetical protein